MDRALRRIAICSALISAFAFSNQAAAQAIGAPSAQLDPDGTVHASGFLAPFSTYASPEAKAAFIKTHQPGHTSAAMAGIAHGDPKALRETLDKALVPQIAHAKALYPVKVEPWTVDGVYTDIVTPASGVPERNAKRVLINLHGGGFVFGARTIALMESIPIASVAGMKIVTVDYRQGPENHFPAASEDVATVYRALLKQYKPENIGIFGCSAGGMLTGEVLIWFQTHNLPRPGAAGMFCAGAGHTLEGDSRYFSAALNGQVPPPPSTPDKPGNLPMAYFDGADPKNPEVTPLESPAMMAKFPPMLLVTATRDIAMSPVITTHQTLSRLGVDAELHVWDGLQHSFFTDIDLPESKEYFDVVSRFFDKQLGH
ncbi:MAG TPA: alpha/beta hydrolase fold domain-containing protein [Alphaproteobacteria bacterium]|jgi:acetyl esterase/lipase|nr:alpha/beta hydrolase fold domain-containing protein [Alphaproteobacteria bacterium]